MCLLLLATIRTIVIFIYYFYLFYLFIFWLCWVSVAAHRIFTAAFKIFPCGSQASLQWQHAGFLSLVVACRLQALQLWHAGSKVHGLCSLWHAGSLVEACELSSCGARGLVAPWHVGSQFPDQGWNLRPLHCKADSLPLDHQGSPHSDLSKRKSFSVGLGVLARFLWPSDIFEFEE